MLGITGIHHIAILTDNYEVSRQFYTEVLGFSVINETYRNERNSYKLDLAVNGTYTIELFSFPETLERASYPEAKGLRHLAFSVDDLEAARGWLIRHGVRIEDIRVDEITGKRFLFFYDPNEQPIELYEAD